MNVILWEKTTYKKSLPTNCQWNCYNIHPRYLSPKDSLTETSHINKTKIRLKICIPKYYMYSFVTGWILRLRVYWIHKKNISTIIQLSTVFHIYGPKSNTHTLFHPLSSTARANEEFQLPGWAGDVRTVGIFHPVMLARVINCALPWDQWACHLGIVRLYIS